MNRDKKSYLKSLFEVAVKQALPETCLPQHLDRLNLKGEVCVIGVGKAALQMAQVVERHFGDKCYGAIVTRYGYSNCNDIGRIKVHQASHPIPDLASVEAGHSLLNIAQQAPENVTVLFLISGGGSALMSLPINGLKIEDKIRVNKILLESGADIHEINTVRKHLSQVKGGGLARAVKGNHHTFVISDVVGDDLDIIASGPTVNDQSTSAQAIEILRRYEFPENDMILSVLQRQTEEKTRLCSGGISLVANSNQSIDKAIELAMKDGWQTQVLNYGQQGEAKDVALEHAKLALDAQKTGKRMLLFSGGELTVTINNKKGRGGPNQEYLLALAIALKAQPGICALACDTDGVDGSEDVAGAFIDNTTLNRAQSLDMTADEYLSQNLSYDFFHGLDDLIITGPTHTNVNDFRVIMVEPD